MTSALLLPTSDLRSPPARRSSQSGGGTSGPRIAILSSGLGHTARGIEAWARSLAESLHREGEDVILFHGGGTYTCPNIKLNYLHRDTLPILLLTRLAPKFTWRWGLTSRYGIEQRLFTRAFLRWLTRQSASSLPDIIHTQDYVVARRLVMALGGYRETSAPRQSAETLVTCDSPHRSQVTGIRRREAGTVLNSRRFVSALQSLQFPNPTGDRETSASRPSLARRLCLGPNISPLHPPAIIFSNVTDEPPHTLAGLPDLQHASQPDYDAAISEPTLAESRHFLVPSFVNTTHFTPATPGQKAEHRHKHGIPESAFVIGCVAALQRHHKRLDSLINEVKALSQATGPETGPRTRTRTLTRQSSPPYLLLAGASTDDTATIERYAHDQLGPNVTILKDQPLSTMPSIYQCMDLYVHPAPEEVFGICLLESMACGVPVIAHNSPRLQYVVGEGGWLTDVTKPGFLTEQWPQIEAELPTAPSRSRQHVESNFSWPAVYQEYMRMYREVMG